MGSVKNRRVLIANRGEMAARIIRTVNASGWTSVLLSSESDETWLPHQLAHETVKVKDYMNLSELDKVLRDRSIDWLHPGAGFHAESAECARLCASLGVRFVGPRPDLLELFSDKTLAKAHAESCGVPTLAWQTLDSSELSYPLILKRKEGGGGKGMCVLNTPEELQVRLRMLSPPDAYYLEEVARNPRHLEVQIFCDYQRSYVISTRDCSIQRRHQKLWEEAPAAYLSYEVNEQLVKYSHSLFAGKGYLGLATVEFLLSDDGKLYFLEINPRLQVEHTVSEVVTGLDLVALQFEILLHEKSNQTFRMPSFEARGHAIEVRVVAEDPYEDFLPSQGIVTGCRWPQGHQVRVESGIVEGSQVTTQYDSLLGKIICWGSDRHAALTRMKQALNEAEVHGLITNLDWLQSVCQRLEECPVMPTTAWMASNKGSFFRQQYDDAQPPHKDLWVKRELAIGICERTDQQEVLDLQPVELRPRAAIAGRVAKVLVCPGDIVKEGEVLIVLEAMKMEIPIMSGLNGRIIQVHVSEEKSCRQGEILLEIERLSNLSV